MCWKLKLFVLVFLTSPALAQPRLAVHEKTTGVSQSDDYVRFGTIFERAAAALLASGRCKAADFSEMGGFIRSTNIRNRRAYFTYCGAMDPQHRIYLFIDNENFRLE
ncbi:hypothetical protein M0638_26930 [Roseomonas sp. NAR14]|uniref:Uncharacterized protein n=1 Tax=Roseomonas acroporae TaxID=2937791 RepID=A0A9X2C0C8_9PROT|nr:hypothetical protein [Roseomonas acroporae]MCK8787995.1 hypothetical protein [Roseomonas acroporae]